MKDKSAFPQIDTENRTADEPQNGYDPRTYSTGGMTLRQYYAAKAMQAIMGNSVIASALVKAKEGMTLKEIEEFDTRILPKMMARVAFVNADAMLAHEAEEAKEDK